MECTVGGPTRSITRYTSSLLHHAWAIATITSTSYRPVSNNHSYTVFVNIRIASTALQWCPLPLFVHTRTISRWTGPFRRCSRASKLGRSARLVDMRAKCTNATKAVHTTNNMTRHIFSLYTCSIHSNTQINPIGSRYLHESILP